MPSLQARLRDLIVAIKSAFNALDGRVTAIETTPPAPSQLPFLGLGSATGDSTNRLAIESEFALLQNSTGSTQFTFGKLGVAENALQQLQEAGTSKARLGLVGDNDFSLMVSEDGLAWSEALKVNRFDGSVQFPKTTMPRAIFPIWAEENSSLGANQTEWAFGNGANTPFNKGIVLPFACELFALSLCLRQGSATVSAGRNGTEVGEIISSGTASHTTLTPPQAFVAGDTLGFRTKAASGTNSPNQITAWFRI